MAKRDIIGADFREPKRASNMVAALEALVDDSPPTIPVPPIPIPVEPEPAAESFEIAIRNNTEDPDAVNSTDG
jgi:hypothetical protein